MIHSMIESLEFWVDPILSQGQVGAGVTMVYFVLNHSLITSLPFWVNRILSIPQQCMIHSCGVDYIRSTQNGSDSLMIISIAIAENIVGAGVTIVYFVSNHSLITSLPFWVNRILSIPQIHSSREDIQYNHIDNESFHNHWDQ